VLREVLRVTEPSLKQAARFDANLRQVERKTEIGKLSAALAYCGLTGVASADLLSEAKKSDNAVTRFRVFNDMERVGWAREEKAWVEAVHLHAQKLADLLANPPRPRTSASLRSNFDGAELSDYGILSPFELEPMARALADAAKKIAQNAKDARRPLGLASAPKRKRNSPMQRLIRDLAALFENITEEDARITRVNDEGAKGGAFFNFICAIAREWDFPPPSVEAVAAALRSD